VCRLSYLPLSRDVLACTVIVKNSSKKTCRASFGCLSAISVGDLSAVRLSADCWGVSVIILCLFFARCISMYGNCEEQL